MPSSRVAADSEPVRAIPSSSAIFPGPIETSGDKSKRNLAVGFDLSSMSLCSRQHIAFASLNPWVVLFHRCIGSLLDYAVGGPINKYTYDGRRDLAILAAVISLSARSRAEACRQLYSEKMT